MKYSLSYKVTIKQDNNKQDAVIWNGYKHSEAWSKRRDVPEVASIPFEKTRWKKIEL